MAENVLKLKKRAVELGMSKDAAKKAGRPELEEFIASAGKSEDGGAQKEKVSKAARKKKVVNKKKVTTPAKKKATGENKSSGRKRAPAEKSEKSGKAKRPASKPKADENEGTGRLNIGTLDWSAESDEWNPRKGGPVERLFKALKKTKGNIDKAFALVEDDMFDFVGKKKRDGSKRTKAEATAMLRYRLNRTKFEFAKRTGQHESATDRAEYGTGQYATTRKKKAPRKAKAENTRKPTRKASTTKKRKTSKK